jgi:EamA-like transporter family
VFMTWGLERARAAKAMTMAYTSIVWTEIAGVFMFQEVPNTWAVLGIVVIVGATLYNSQARIQSAQPGEASSIFSEASGSNRSDEEKEAILHLAKGPSESRTPESTAAG